MCNSINECNGIEPNVISLTKLPLFFFYVIFTLTADQRNGISCHSITHLFARVLSSVDRYRSHGQRRCKFLGTKDVFYVRKELNST